MSKRLLIMTAAALFALGVACGDDNPEESDGAGGDGGSTGTAGSGGPGAGGSGGSGAGGSGGSGAGAGGSGGSGGAGGTGGWIDPGDGPECREIPHLSRLVQSSVNAYLSTGFMEDGMFRDLVDGEVIEMRAIRSEGTEMTFTAKDTEWPEEGDPVAKYILSFPQSIQSGAFQSRERVDLVQEGNWTILYGAPNIVALYRFESLEGLPTEGYDPSLVLSEQERITMSSESFCVFASSCDQNPGLFALVAEYDDEELILYDLEKEELAGDWHGELGPWTIRNDAFSYMPGVHCTEENRNSVSECHGVPDGGWTCHQPYFTQVITAVKKN